MDARDAERRAEKLAKDGSNRLALRLFLKAIHLREESMRESPTAEDHLVLERSHRRCAELHDRLGDGHSAAAEQLDEAEVAAKGRVQ